MKRKIMFLTGTRADFGKLKPLISAVHGSPEFDYMIFVTGMHTIARYGYTVDEVLAANFRNVYTYMNHSHGEPMEIILANTVAGLSRYVQELGPDMLIVHGDRVETLAGAIVGSMRNVPVAHVEGGEMSGTVDELIRHAVSKLSHAHFVANDSAAIVLQQLGERSDSVFVIGSPDIDAMMASTLPSVEEARRHYELQFAEYAIALFHPVTTELEALPDQVRQFVNALVESEHNYVLIYPNNDVGSELIFQEYRRLASSQRFRIFPSVRFEYFVSLLKHAEFIIGNSSAGIREAPVYAVPTVDVGTRQNNRYAGPSILRTDCATSSILKAIKKAKAMRGKLKPSHHFGQGDSAARFMEALKSERLWSLPRQKQFVPLAASRSQALA